MTLLEHCCAAFALATVFAALNVTAKARGFDAMARTPSVWWLFWAVHLAWRSAAEEGVRVLVLRHVPLSRAAWAVVFGAAHASMWRPCSPRAVAFAAAHGAATAALGWAVAPMDWVRGAAAHAGVNVAALALTWAWTRLPVTSSVAISVTSPPSWSPPPHRPPPWVPRAPRA